MNCKHSNMEILQAPEWHQGRLQEVHLVLQVSPHWRFTSDPPESREKYQEKNQVSCYLAHQNIILSNWPRSALATQKRDPIASKADKGDTIKFCSMPITTIAWPWNNCQRNGLIKSWTLILMQTLLKAIIITCSDAELIKWLRSFYFLVKRFQISTTTNTSFPSQGPQVPHQIVTNSLKHWGHHCTVLDMYGLHTTTLQELMKGKH